MISITFKKPVTLKLVIILLLTQFCYNSFAAKTYNIGDSILTEKVKRAMLAMERRAWEQGVASQALLEWGDYDNVILLAKDAVVNQLKDGRLALNEGNIAVTDPASNGEPLLYAAKATKDERLKKAAENMLGYLMYKAPRNRDGIIFHNCIENRIWVDACYMAPPYLAVCGQYKDALLQINGYRRILQDPETKLYFHIWDDDTHSFKRKLLWGVGNGWAAAGITRVIKNLPDTMKKEKALLAGYVKEIIDGAIKFECEEGLFHDILNDPASFVETNSAQMYSYAIYRGVKGGWLDVSYIKYADKMRNAVHKKVDEYGLVQGVCGAPYFNKSGTATEGQAFFILMESAYRDYINP